MTQHVFISYAPPDKAVAGSVCASLEAGGIACWIEPRDVHGAESRGDALDEAAALVVIFSRAANVSRQVRDDTAAAAAAGVAIVPFHIDAVEPTGALRLRLSAAEWVEAATPPLEAHFGALLDRVARQVPGATIGRPVSALAPPARAVTGAPPGASWIEAQEGVARPRVRRGAALIAVGVIVVLLVVLGLGIGGVLKWPAQQQAANAPPTPPIPVLPLPPPPAPMPAMMGSSEPAPPLPPVPPLPAAEMPTAPVRVLAGDTGAVGAIAFAPDGRLLLSGSDDRTVKLWDVVRGREAQTLPAGAGGIAAVAFSPRGDLVAWSTGRAAAEPGAAPMIWLWDVARRRGVAPLAADPGERAADSPRAIAFSPDGRSIAAGDDRGAIRVWEIASRRLVRRWPAHAKGVTSVAFSPDGKLLASGGGDGIVQLWDAATGDNVRALTGHSRWVRSVAFSPDGHTVASASEDRTIRLWDASSGRPEHILKGHARWVRSIAFSPDGRTLASGGQDNAVKLWNVANGRELRTLSGHTGPVLAVAFSPEGGLLASAGADRTIRLWNLATIEEAGR